VYISLPGADWIYFFRQSAAAVEKLDGVGARIASNELHASMTQSVINVASLLRGQIFVKNAK